MYHPARRQWQKSGSGGQEGGGSV
ncbi:hypothetical protein FOXYSP1_06520 [Fusarium oxysporum f. sp. phaseoli]